MLCDYTKVGTPRQASAISSGLANHTARGAFFRELPPHLLTQINAPATGLETLYATRAPTIELL
jgi:hypothetical protein